MDIDYFRIWLTKKENVLFWHKPLASEIMDELITDKYIQKSIAACKSNQAFYAFFENVIVSDYALLIEIKLRQAFNFLVINEFKDPSGFERKEKSSLRQQKYFNTRHHLEFLLKQDIIQHEHPDAQLNAFRRWIDIANALLQRHCYEGFLLVIVNIQLLATSALIKGLPASTRAAYLAMCELSSSSKNHSALRQYIQKNQRNTDLEPLLFWYHAIILLNASMEKLKDAKAVLLIQNEHLKQRISVYSNEPEHVHLKELLKERSSVRKQLRGISKQLKDQTIQRESILEKIKAAQQVVVVEIPLNLEQTYSQVCSRYNKHAIEVAREQRDFEPTRKNTSTSSNLYSNKLLPSFWNRRGKSANKYWAEIFSGSIIPEKAVKA